MQIPSEDLYRLSLVVLEALGAPTEIADHVATSFLRADVRGYDTHGVGLLPLYAEMIKDGAIDPTAKPVVEHGEGVTLSVDGQNGFGQLAAREATASGIAAAESHGVAVVGLRRGSHLGRMGEMAERAAEMGMIFLGFTNAGGGAKNVAPFGGHERKLVPNTICIGIPTLDVYPFNVIVDFATSQVSGSVIRRHYRTGESLHEDWTITESGDPVSDPATFMEGEGALLPLGGRVTGHKGYGLSIAAELLGGLVGGEVVIGERDPTWFSNGGAFTLIDPTVFVDRSVLATKVEALGTHLRNGRVRLPGEGAYERRERSLAEGVRVDAYDLVPLVDLGESLSVDLPQSIRAATSAAEDEVGGDSRTW